MKTITAIIILVILIALGFGLTKIKPNRNVVEESVPSASVTPEPSQTPTATLLPLNPRTTMPTVSLNDVKPISTTVKVTLKTSKGDIQLDLNGAAAPMAVGNFVYLAKQHFYDGVTFHRVIPKFMIQAGDPLSKDPAARMQHGTGGPGYEFKNENNALKFVRGTIGMANSGPDTNGSQFFIVTGQAFPDLDGGYTNFGTVTSGMDVADAISNVPRDDRDNPTEAITIQSVEVSE